MGLSHVISIGRKRDREGRGGVYRFWRDHRKVKYMEALVEDAEVEDKGYGEAIEKMST